GVGLDFVGTAPVPLPVLKMESKTNARDDDYFEKKHQSAKRYRDPDPAFDPDLEDESLTEKELDDRVEAEFNAKLRAAQEGTVMVSRNPVAQAIVRGFTM
ncbi:unnamed protein product, partial [Heterosigma akashiwo]